MTRGKYLRIVDYEINDIKLRTVCRFLEVDKYTTHWWITTTCELFHDARVFSSMNLSYRHHRQSIRRNFRAQMQNELTKMFMHRVPKEQEKLSEQAKLF